MDVSRRWQPATLQISVQVVQPLLFEQTTLFVGSLGVGRPWEHALHYGELVPGVEREVRVVSGNRWLEAKLDPDRDVLQLRVTAPHPGRFDGHVRIEFDRDVPPLRIRVSGIGVAASQKQTPAPGTD